MKMKGMVVDFWLLLYYLLCNMYGVTGSFKHHEKRKETYKKGNSVFKSTFWC